MAEVFPRRPRVLALAVLIASCVTSVAVAASDQGGSNASHEKEPVRIDVELPAQVDFDTPAEATVRIVGSKERLRKARVELRIGNAPAQSVVDKARARPNKAINLSWPSATGEGVVRAQVVVVRRGKVLARSKRQEIFVRHDTEVIDPATIVEAPAPGEAGDLVTTAPPPNPGDIVSAGVGPSTPFGFLGIAKSVDSQDGQTSISTEPTSLLAAVPDGDFSITASYESGAFPSRQMAPDGTTNFVKPARPVHIRAVVECTGGAKVEVEGTAALEPYIEVDADWGFFSLDSARFDAVLNLESSLSASAEAQANCVAGPTEIARYFLAPIAFTVGPVPVVLTPRVVVTLEADGSVSARVRAAVTGAVEGRAGVLYEDGDFTPSGSIDPSLDYEPPVLQSAGHLGATVSPSLDLLLYGVTGPSVFVDAGMSLDAVPGADPWWTLTAPVRVGARLVAPVLKLSSGDLVVYDQTFTLAEADSGTDPPPDEQRASISWDTNGSDVDLHVWDDAGNHAWYSEQEGIPDGLLSVDITDGYGPEVFSDTSGSGRTLTYGLCFYDDHGTGATNVSVDIVDPSGDVRSSSHRLEATGHQVLLGSSPAGGGYVPEEGWCDTAGRPFAQAKR